MKVKYIDLSRQWDEIRPEALNLIDQVLSSGKYLDHPIIEELELNLSNFLGLKGVCVLNSCTDSLVFSMSCLGIKKGDEVITVPNSFIASVSTIIHIGAVPKFVDVDETHLMDISKIEKLITAKTKAIMPVHLEGKVVNMPEINKIAKDYNLLVIEDAAQAFGSKYGRSFAGTTSDAGCFSFHPLKNLNGLGDGGFVASNNMNLINKIKALRNHGQVSRNNSDFFGYVSRMDSIQAVVINYKLQKFNDVLEKRKFLASHYDSRLREFVKIPRIDSKVSHTYHLYVIEVENRDGLAKFLLEKGIETKVHYPNLITNQKAFLNLGILAPDIRNAELQSKLILSLPIHQHLTLDQIDYVCDSIIEFLR